jgi:hypothetical protein
LAELFFGFLLGDNAPSVAANPKLNPAYLFGLLNEVVFVLLGALLMFIALSQRFSPPRNSVAWIGLGAILIYWGLRIWIRSVRAKPRWPSGVRAGSLALVGAIVLGIAFLPFPFAGPLLAAAGGVLVLRGLVSAVAFARSDSGQTGGGLQPAATRPRNREP